MSYVKLGAVVLALLGVTAFVWASESDELREKARAMQREAAELAEQGHAEEAANLQRKAMMMLEAVERLQPRGVLEQSHPEIARMKAMLEKLRQKEMELEATKLQGGEEEARAEALAMVRREAGEIQARLRELSHRPHHGQAPPHEEIARRLEHMRIAVDHLNQAGLHDVAEHVAQRADAAARELHPPRPEHGGDVMHGIMKQLDELRHEVGRLRAELNELRNNR